MRVHIVPIATGSMYTFPMLWYFDAFCRSGLQSPGYSLLEGELPSFRTSSDFIRKHHVGEYLASEMYEGGKNCGVCYAEGKKEALFVWALMPESATDMEHIEKVILTYGRGPRVEPVEPVDEYASADTKVVRVNLGAITRQQWSGYVQVPIDFDDFEELASRFYDKICGSDFSIDSDYWEKGQCWVDAKVNTLQASKHHIAYSVSTDWDGGMDINDMEIQ